MFEFDLCFCTHFPGYIYLNIWIYIYSLFHAFFACLLVCLLLLFYKYCVLVYIYILIYMIFFRTKMCQSVWAAITEYQRLHGLKQQTFISHDSGGQEFYDQRPSRSSAWWGAWFADNNLLLKSSQGWERDHLSLVSSYKDTNPVEEAPLSLPPEVPTS